MSLEKSLKSIIIPEAVEFDFYSIDDLFNQLYKPTEQKILKQFVREILQILNIYDFEFVKFTYDKHDKSYKCYLSELEIFSIGLQGFLLFVDPLPMSQDVKKEIISLTTQANQSNPELSSNYGSNVVKIHCNPGHILALEEQLLKGFRYLISSLMDISFSSKDQDHDLEFLQYFDLTFLLDIEKNDIENLNSQSDDINQIFLGESELIEYKSSAFWSDRVDLSNSNLSPGSKISNLSHNDVLKTINGFMNSKGGVLILGLHDVIKDSDTGWAVLRKDFQDEFYSFSDFDRYLLKLMELLNLGFGSVSSELCTIEKIDLGSGPVHDGSIVPESRDRLERIKEQMIKYTKPRVLIKITVKPSLVPVFVELKPEKCRDHNCSSCPEEIVSKRIRISNSSSAYFVRSAGSNTIQYNFQELIEHISIRYPKYFSFIADKTSEEISE